MILGRVATMIQRRFGHECGETRKVIGKGIHLFSRLFLIRARCLFDQWKRQELIKLKFIDTIKQNAIWTEKTNQRFEIFRTATRIMHAPALPRKNAIDQIGKLRLQLLRLALVVAQRRARLVNAPRN